MKDWDIQKRSDICRGCEKPFLNGSFFQCRIILPQAESEEILRRDYCLDCWSKLPDEEKTHPHWKGMVKITPSIEAPKPLKDELIDPVLKNMLQSSEPLHRKSCYILLVMLERKKIMVQRESFQKENQHYLVFENIKNGDSIIIEDPRIHLSQIDQIQVEVKPILDEFFEKAEAEWVSENTDNRNQNTEDRRK